MVSSDLLDTIKAKQRAWAARLGIDPDKDGYCRVLEQNLLQPLAADSRNDFDAGDGSELGKPGGRGKIQALHSSSALACNFFDYWRERDLDPLARAFGITGRLRGLAFEQRFPTGLGGKAPNLDVVLYQDDGSLFAIESKFTEPFILSKTKNFLKPTYFHCGRTVWAAAGLVGCQAAAEDIRDGRLFFELLDAAQLLKHMLGLARSGHKWSLCYLWYNPGGLLADQHQKELLQFAQRIGNDSSHFTSLTYQDLFRRLCGLLGEEHAGYTGYLKDRYLADARD